MKEPNKVFMLQQESLCRGQKKKKVDIYLLNREERPSRAEEMAKVKAQDVEEMQMFRSLSPWRNMH